MRFRILTYLVCSSSLTYLTARECPLLNTNRYMPRSCFPMSQRSHFLLMPMWLAKSLGRGIWPLIESPASHFWSLLLRASLFHSESFFSTVDCLIKPWCSVCHLTWSMQPQIHMVSLPRVSSSHQPIRPLAPHIRHLLKTMIQLQVLPIFCSILRTFICFEISH